MLEFSLTCLMRYGVLLLLSSVLQKHLGLPVIALQYQLLYTYRKMATDFPQEVYLIRPAESSLWPIHGWLLHLQKVVSAYNYIRSLEIKPVHTKLSSPKPSSWKTDLDLFSLWTGTGLGPSQLVKTSQGIMPVNWEEPLRCFFMLLKIVSFRCRTSVLNWTLDSTVMMQKKPPTTNQPKTPKQLAKIHAFI